MKFSQFLTLSAFCLLLVAISFATAHKKFYGGGAPIYEQPQRERCVCDCAQQGPILPNKPYYGSGGYAQPRPSGGGYGNAGSYAVAGSYGSGGGQTSGGY